MALFDEGIGGCYLYPLGSFWAKKPLRVNREITVKVLSGFTSGGLANSLIRSNVFRRHARDRDFYVIRANALGGKTVIELMCTERYLERDIGRVVNLVENVIFATSVFCLRRQDRFFNERMGSDLYVSTDCSSVSSNLVKNKKTYILPIDEKYLKHYKGLGFENNFENIIFKNNEIVRKVANALEWLKISLQDPILTTSLVKLATAFEALLLFENEHKKFNLKRRASILIGRNEDEKIKIEDVMVSFYDARCSIVHEGTNYEGGLGLIDFLDRLLVLVITKLLSNTDSVFDKRIFLSLFRRDGENLPDLETPFSTRYISNIFRLKYSI